MVFGATATVSTIKLLVAGYGLLQSISPEGKGLTDAAKAFADVLDNGTKLDKLLGDKALLPMLQDLQAVERQIRADFRKAQYGHKPQAEDAINLFDQVAGRVVPTPDELAKLHL